MPDRAKEIDSLTNDKRRAEATAKAETVSAIQAGLADVAAERTNPAPAALSARQEVQHR